MSDEIKPIESLDEMRTMLLRLEQLEARAEQIANKLCDRSASFKRFTSTEVEYEYNNSCNCHPEDCTGSYSLDLLFDPDLDARLEAERLRAEALKRKAAEAEEARRVREKERRERSEFERLKKKFESDKTDAQKDASLAQAVTKFTKKGV